MLPSLPVAALMSAALAASMGPAVERVALSRLEAVRVLAPPASAVRPAVKRAALTRFTHTHGDAATRVPQRTYTRGAGSLGVGLTGVIGYGNSRLSAISGPHCHLRLTPFLTLEDLTGVRTPNEYHAVRGMASELPPNVLTIHLWPTVVQHRAALTRYVTHALRRRRLG